MGFTDLKVELIVLCGGYLFSFLLSIIAIPLAIYQSQSGSECISLWGYRENCNEPKLSLEVDHMSNCFEFTRRIKWGAALGIISIFFSFTGFMLVYCYSEKARFVQTTKNAYRLILPHWVMLTTVVALTTSSYRESLCGQPSFQSVGRYKYGPGYVLWVLNFCAWTLVFVAVSVLLILRHRCKVFDDNEETVASEPIDDEPAAKKPVKETGKKTEKLEPKTSSADPDSWESDDE